MLFQFLVSVAFQFGVNDLYARLLSVAFGIATIFVVAKLGQLLYGRWVGVTAALLLAVMPYHVIVTRQVLLDGPMVFFTTLTLYLVAKFATTRAAHLPDGDGSVARSRLPGQRDRLRDGGRGLRLPGPLAPDSGSGSGTWRCQSSASS